MDSATRREIEEIIDTRLVLRLSELREGVVEDVAHTIEIVMGMLAEMLEGQNKVAINRVVAVDLLSAPITVYVFEPR